MTASPIWSTIRARATGLKVNKSCLKIAYHMIVPAAAKPIGVGSGASSNPPARKTALAASGTSAATSTASRWARNAGCAFHQPHATRTTPTATIR